MPSNTGLLTIHDLIEVENQSILEYGLDDIAAVVAEDLAAHNTQMVDMVSTLATVTTERAETYGAQGGGKLQKVDQFGRAPTQKTGGKSPVGYPLEKYQFNIGWTRNFARKMSPADMARQTLNAQDQHRLGVIEAIKEALFVPTNYEFTDYLEDDLELTVRRLLNGDGEAIPGGPNGETFDGASHSHYNAVNWASADAAAKNAALKGLVEDVVEHGHGARPAVVIGRGDESRIAEATDFIRLDPVQVIQAEDVLRARGTIAQPVGTPGQNLYNRQIGTLATSQAEVWVKPWGVVGYPVATDLAAGAGDKPLAFRQRPGSSAQGLQLVTLTTVDPLTAEIMEAEFGFGARTRTAAAVLYLGGGTYTAPSF